MSRVRVAGHPDVPALAEVYSNTVELTVLP
jgi:hypothetical protein